MLVEDDVVLGTTLAKVLESAGYRVRIVATGARFTPCSGASHRT
jgi:DNA-binding response OmpR family regulator